MRVCGLNPCRRSLCQHAIGTSVKVVTVWDEPVAYYLAYVHNHLRLHVSASRGDVTGE